jgi:hypothetical protein
VGGLAGLMGPGSKLLVTVPHANQKLNPKHYQHFTRASLEAALGPRLEVGGTSSTAARGRWRSGNGSSATGSSC